MPIHFSTYSWFFLERGFAFYFPFVILQKKKKIITTNLSNWQLLTLVLLTRFDMGLFPLWSLLTTHHYRSASRKGHSHIKCTSFNIRSRTSEEVVIFPVTGGFATFTKITLFFYIFCIYISDINNEIL